MRMVARLPATMDCSFAVVGRSAAKNKEITKGARIKMNTTMKSALLVSCATAMLLPFAAVAQVNSKNQGYLVDQEFRVVTAVGGTVCVRTSDWTPARAAAAEAGPFCDRDLVPQKPAPAASQPKSAAPAPKAATPETSKPAPQKMLPQKINFASDALFDFNKADLRSEGRTMLDELARTLQGASYEVILAIGHADRIGSKAYNQKLSLRRAEAVKKYLVDKGIAPNRIYVDGKGETQPVTKPGDCRMKNRKALIACLQPDRRVAVEVNGTK